MLLDLGENEAAFEFAVEPASARRGLHRGAAAAEHRPSASGRPVQPEEQPTSELRHELPIFGLYAGIALAVGTATSFLLA